MLKRMATLLGGSMAGQLVTIAAVFDLTREGRGYYFSIGEAF